MYLSLKSFKFVRIDEMAIDAPQLGSLREKRQMPYTSSLRVARTVRLLDFQRYVHDTWSRIMDDELVIGLVKMSFRMR